MKGKVAQELTCRGMIGVEVAIKEEEALHGAGAIFTGRRWQSSEGRLNAIPHLPPVRQKVSRRLDDIHAQDHTNLATEEVEQNCYPLLTGDAVEQAESVAKGAFAHTNLIT